MLGEILAIEARTEHSVGAALGGERPIVHPRRDMRPDAVVEARDVGLRDALVGPPHLVWIADRNARDLDRLNAHDRSTCTRRAICRCGFQGTPADGASRRRSTPRRRAARRDSDAPMRRRAFAAPDRMAACPCGAA